MATPQLSPGVITREVDLTVGRADNVLENIGAIAGPFAIGPVDEPTTIRTEQELINTFGKPLSTDGQYEYWMTASSFLSYGGVLKVVRTSGTTLNNSSAGVGSASSPDIQIDNYDDYATNHSAVSVDFTYASKNPGSWANNLKVCFIDDLGDQIVGVSTNDLGALGATIGAGVTTLLTGEAIPKSNGTIESFTGYLKGIITGVTTDATNSNSKVTLKILSRVSAAGTESKITYGKNTTYAAFPVGCDLKFVSSAGNVLNPTTTCSCTSVSDWYEEQTLGLSNATIYWKSIAPKPVSNNSSLNSSGRNDGLHVVLVDDTGNVTGVKGNIVEKHLNLSKAVDAVSNENAPTKIWYKDYLALYSNYVYAGRNPSSAVDAYWGTTPRATGFTTYSGVPSASFTPLSTANGLWGQNAQGIEFSAIGNVTYTLTGGVDYQVGGGMNADLTNIISSYDLFSNKDRYPVDFILGGPGEASETESQAKAAKLISIAEGRKDCIACISPYSANVLNITNSDTQTSNVASFFSGINASVSSSSYAVFDSGYKYMYDRFNNSFEYVPCNGDVAGLMVRSSLNSYPWVSPAGQQRGILNNAIKLAYNPSKDQRDILYTARVNAIINQSGVGILLFGDKTALGYASAFDRINVRRLFITVEKALERAAQSQLFELNDEITRSNFVNIVEPYLRDIQAKRGLYDFRVICDQTNNTPDVIDNNEFRADIFLKPTRSINYVTLTFVATRTGISFEEVTGRV
jgi:hypothetical protein